MYFWFDIITTLPDIHTTCSTNFNISDDVTIGIEKKERQNKTKKYT